MTHTNSVSEVILVEDSPCSSSSTFTPKYNSLLGRDFKLSLKRKRQQRSSVQWISSDEDVAITAEQPKTATYKRRARRIRLTVKRNSSEGLTPTTDDFHEKYAASHPPRKGSKKNLRKRNLGGQGEKTVISVGETTNCVSVTDNIESCKGKQKKKKKKKRSDLPHDAECADTSLGKIKKRREKSLESLSNGLNVIDICKDAPETTEKNKKHKSITSQSSISNTEEHQSSSSDSEENELVSPPKNAHKSLSVGDKSDNSGSNVSPSSERPEVANELADESDVAVEVADESDDAVNNTIISINSDTEVSASVRTRPTHTAAVSDATIVLSDDEDDLEIIKSRISTSSDIIVLGSPVVPTVTNYKGVSKNKNRSTATGSLYPSRPIAPLVQQPTLMSGVLPSPVTNALLQLSKIPNWMQMLASQGALQPARGIYYDPQPLAVAHSEQNPSPSRKRYKGVRPLASADLAQNPSTSGHPSNYPQMSENRRPENLKSPDNKYGSNIYNPTQKSVTKQGLRPIIIDGSNVAMGHGLGKYFSAKGLEICVNYFLKRNHKVYAFLPMFRKNSFYTRDTHILHRLEQEKHLIYTPSRKVDGKNDVPYDDRYIVQTAAELGGVIVSTDNYRDLLEENQSWHDTIKNRLLMFTWVEDILMFPQDPLGKRGPKLEAFLRF